MAPGVTAVAATVCGELRFLPLPVDGSAAVSGTHHAEGRFALRHQSSPTSSFKAVSSLRSNSTCSLDGSAMASRLRSVVLRNDVSTVALIHVVKHGFSDLNRLRRIQSSCAVVQSPG